ncbi:thiamine-phosphate kinase [Persephonella sp.]
MEIGRLGEFGLIDRLVKLLEIKDPSVVVGFGDDCSAVSVDGKLLLFTGDIQLEGRHFIKKLTPPEDLGWKLVSVNVSDVVACGGKPEWGFISVGFPPELGLDYVEGIYRGINKASRHYRMSVIGGNTTSSDSIILDLFLTGTTRRFIPRSGATDGQIVVLSGYTGLARAGLELLMMEKKEYQGFEKRLIDAFLKPVARLDLSEKLSRYASSAIDISDGLAGDTGHLAESSGVKIVFDKEKLPVNEDLLTYCRKAGKNVYDYMLYGGEDYQILFSVDRDNLRYFPECFPVGSIEKGTGLFLKDGGREVPIRPEGFTHI